jgi:hypothetical protein
MRRLLGEKAESKTVKRIKLVQKFVIGYLSSPALGLMALNRYGCVAVEGISAKKAVYEALGFLKKYLAGLLEGAEEESATKAALNLISKLYEEDLKVRRNWIEIGITLSLGLSLFIAFLSYRIIIPPFIPLLLLSLYPLMPGYSELKIEDPNVADAMASDLERGSGVIYALRHLKLYEASVVDDVELPSYFEFLKMVSDREALKNMMRRTASILRALNEILDEWKANIKSTRILLIISLVVVASINVALSYILGQLGLNAPQLTLFSLGLAIAILISKPLAYSIQAALAYSSAFLLASYLFHFL